MFKPINSRVDEPAIRELLECAVVFDPDALEAAARLYRNGDAYKLYGYEEENGYAGIIGFRVNASRTLEITHLAVHPEQRMKGYGRALVLLALTEAGPERMEAVTDEEGADFSAASGFRLPGFGMKLPGRNGFAAFMK
ncbi:hypothetical protein HMSSN139_26860 [Paenibacillus sp. HMSSN-139]|nr:hypothetical protein HMSSN139_26860 [Paenibacillus sp. HMSSN-139]